VHRGRGSAKRAKCLPSNAPCWGPRTHSCRCSCRNTPFTLHHDRTKLTPKRQWGGADAAARRMSRQGLCAQAACLAAEMRSATQMRSATVRPSRPRPCRPLPPPAVRHGSPGSRARTKCSPGLSSLLSDRLLRLSPTRFLAPPRTAKHSFGRLDEEAFNHLLIQSGVSLLTRRRACVQVESTLNVESTFELVVISPDHTHMHILDTCVHARWDTLRFTRMLACMDKQKKAHAHCAREGQAREWE
jgi:hypothetical protein